MTNVEFRMTEAKLFSLIRISDSFRHSTFVIRLSLVLLWLCEDLSGGIWLHTANGLVRRFRDGNTVMTPDLKLEGCGRLAVDNSGIVWVWTLDGWLRSPGQVPSMTIPVGQLDFMLPSKAGGY